MMARISKELWALLFVALIVADVVIMVRNFHLPIQFTIWEFGVILVSILMLPIAWVKSDELKV